MHILIVCGTPWCDLGTVFAQLQSTGLSAALPAQTGSVASVADWHQRLFCHRPKATQPIQPGKAWEHAAGEVFLANWEQPLWGWADHRSTWLLDFWQHFDPQTRFVLVHTPAVETLVAAAEQTSLPGFDATQVLDSWCAHQAEMLQFYLRHRDRCVWLPRLPMGTQQTTEAAPALEMLPASEVSEESGAAEACADADLQTLDPLTLEWPISAEWILALRQQLQSTDDPTVAILRTLATKTVQLHEQASALQNEVLACLPGCDMPPAPAALLPVSQQAANLLNQVRQVVVMQGGALRQPLLLKAQTQTARLQNWSETETEAKEALQAQLDAQTQAHTEAVEESELLLLQLHQVQEELEHYFLQHQQAEQACQQLQQRLQRWAQRYPDHCEWDGLAMLPQADANQQDVLISHLHYGGRTLEQLHLQLRHTKKQTQLVLQQQAGQPAPLLHWPQKTAGTELLLDLAAKPGTPEAAVLATLAPSDLQLLKAVCKAVASSLPANAPQQSSWAAHWQAVSQGLEQLPTTWRFDTLSLRHEQVNPDYEYLWLCFHNAQYGSRHWPAFEFRLSASNVRKNQFSYLPKLEFPLPDNNGAKQFEHWFDESEDDKGPKFELRFDIKTPGLDVACWNALSAQDQAQALALVSQLPSFLQQLEQSGTSIHRPWADWQRMASGIQQALITCLAIDPLLVGHAVTSSASV